jgi:hypothetical protein
MDLAVEISDLTWQQQLGFRYGWNLFADRLRARLEQNLAISFEFAARDIVITHYMNLGDGNYVVEGFVDRGNLYDLHVPFKAIVDINLYNDQSQNSTLVFVPRTLVYDATQINLGDADDWYTLNLINKRIEEARILSAIDNTFITLDPTLAIVEPVGYIQPIYP